MVYGKILFNNVKEYTPSWMKTIPYSQTTKPTFIRKPQIVSRFNADPKVKCAWRWFQNNIQKNPFYYQVFIFAIAFGFSQACFWPWYSLYVVNNKNRTLDAALAIEKEYKRKKKLEEDAAEAAEAAAAESS